jgi:hypothetical protein
MNLMGLKPYYIDDNHYPKPQTDANEMVICAYDGMKMRKSDIGASMIYQEKTLYFYTLDEMVEFMKKKGIFPAGKIKPKMKM